jgi:GTP 3',8-cyclase
MVTADEIMSLLVDAGYRLEAHGRRTHAPAEEFDVVDGPGQPDWAEPVGRLGIIASVTRPFCGSCDRVRLTADGQIRNCLFAREESDLRAAMRGGAGDEELAERWLRAMAVKLPGHGIDDPTFLQPDRPMSAIGG